MPRKRRRPTMDLKPCLHIYCEGEKTEPNYLNEYIARCFPGLKLVKVKVEKTDKTTPVQLVEVAIEAKKDGPDGDEFWVVYDRESPIKYEDAKHLTARNKADSAGVHIALSNVCFEIWLLLHFRPTVRSCDSCDDLCGDRSFKEHLPNYGKGEKRKYTAESVASARENAKRLNASTKRGADPAWKHPHQWNPYTDVYKLLDTMDAFDAKCAAINAE
jgi:hypothetical protein